MLPKDLENIIMVYKRELEHHEKQQEYLDQVCTIIRRFKMQFKLVADLVQPIINGSDPNYLHTLTAHIQGHDLHSLLDTIQAILSSPPG